MAETSSEEEVVPEEAVFLKKLLLPRRVPLVLSKDKKLSFKLPVLYE